MNLTLGQTILWDGLHQIVVAVTETHARIATKSAKDALRSVVIEREQNEFYGNKPGTMGALTQPGNWPGGLQEFLAALGDEMAVFIGPITEDETVAIPEPENHKLRVGQIVIHEEHKRAVVVSEIGFARLLRIDGETTAVENPLECSLVQPTNTANLETFLNANGDMREGITKPITDEEKQKVMANKKKNEVAPKSAMSKLLAKSNKDTAALLAGKGDTIKPHDESARSAKEQAKQEAKEQKQAAKAAKDAERSAAKQATIEAKAKVKEEKAAAKAAKPQKVAGQSNPASKGKCGALFGFSVVAAMKAAGKVGVTVEQAQKVLANHSLSFSDSTLKRCLRLGKLGIAGAPLTEDNLKEFNN